MVADRIGERIERQAQHAFVRQIEWLADLAAPSRSYKWPPESGLFPTSEHTFNVEPEMIPTCEEVYAALHRTRNILRTFQQIRRISSAIVGIDFSKNTNQSAGYFEFEVENYYLRLPTVLEQVHELISILCEIGDEPGVGRIRRIEKLISEKEPELWRTVTKYRHAMTATKSVRNVVAHLGEFVDEAYETIGALAELPWSGETPPWILDGLQAYREHFLAICESQLKEAVAFVERTFDLLSVITRARYKEEVKPDRTIMFRRTTAKEEAVIRQRLQQAH